MKERLELPIEGCSGIIFKYCTKLEITVASKLECLSVASILVLPKICSQGGSLPIEGYSSSLKKGLNMLECLSLAGISIIV